MEVQGVLGKIQLDGDWVTITKKRPGERAITHRISIRDITATTVKEATRWHHGYIQFQVAGAIAAPELRGGMASGRPPWSDPNSISIPRRSNKDAEEFVRQVEDARVHLSR